MHWSRTGVLTDWSTVGRLSAFVRFICVHSLNLVLYLWFLFHPGHSADVSECLAVVGLMTCSWIGVVLLLVRGVGGLCGGLPSVLCAVSPSCMWGVACCDGGAGQWVCLYVTSFCGSGSLWICGRDGAGLWEGLCVCSLWNGCYALLCWIDRCLFCIPVTGQLNLIGYAWFTILDIDTIVREKVIPAGR